MIRSNLLVSVFITLLTFTALQAQTTFKGNQEISGNEGPVSTPQAPALVIDPTYGDGTWLVHCYNGVNLNTYRGVYSEPSLTFKTKDRWNENQNPSNASGYVGSNVNSNWHSLSHRRTGFACGTYNIDVRDADDFIKVIIDGKVVYDGGRGRQNDIWDGFLGTNSGVEVIHGDYFGKSKAEVRFTQTSGAISLNVNSMYDCSNGEFTLNAAGATDIVWTPNLDLNIDTGATVIVDAISVTRTYTATGKSVCDGSTVSANITVGPSHTALNQNTFGDNEWIVYCYDDNNFTTYDGIYTEPLLDFDTRDRWNENRNPSEMPDYLGCSMNNNQNSYSHKRKGFACGNYNIDVKQLKGEGYLYIDGVLVWSKTTDGNENDVWDGFLGVNSEVEVRQVDLTDKCRIELAFNFTAIAAIPPNSFIETTDYNYESPQTITYSVNNTIGAEFDWNVGGGSIVSGQGTNSIVTTGNVTSLTLNETSGCGVVDVVNEVRPMCVVPYDGKVDHRTNTKLWSTPVPGVSPGLGDFTFEVAEDVGFTTVVASVTDNIIKSNAGIDYPSHNHISDLAINTTYYIRTSVNGNPWGKATSFTTMGPSGWVTNPFHTSITTGTTVTVTSAEVVGASTYTIELNTAPDFSGTPIIGVSNTNKYTFAGLNTSTTYYTRVKTDLSEPSWGPTTYFITGMSAKVVVEDNPVKEELENQIVVNTVPNPAVNNIAFFSKNINLNTFNNVTIVIENIVGQKVMVIENTIPTKQINIESLVKGNYNVTIMSTEGNVFRSRFVKM